MELILTQLKAPLPSHWMDMYLLKRNGEWLKTGDFDVQQLMRLKKTDGILALMKKHGVMHYLSCVSDPAYGLPDTEDVGDDDVHVLVQVIQRRRPCKLELSTYLMCSCRFGYVR
ncbi:hypothetical protein DYB35_013206 [Aphanomyces astaci]|uniref:Uncharacterized protein n=1 Tax=Aphanomyces astaci TaxID=112090 RepID=A0A418DZ62_APHAT|nr:hypothetical protein DYB35_013206 [Aphanomyces astaci]